MCSGPSYETPWPISLPSIGRAWVERERDVSVVGPQPTLVLDDNGTDRLQADLFACPVRRTPWIVRVDVGCRS